MNKDKILLPLTDKELIAQCQFHTYRASGSGGQHVNVTDSAVRLIHLPTGLVLTSQKERSQHLNKKECLFKLRKKVEVLNYRPSKRRATCPPYSAKVKNSLKKSKQSEKKKWRQPPSQDKD